MNRLVAITAATVVSFAAQGAFAAEPDAPTKAPRVDAGQAEADRAYVRTVGILGMLEAGDATQAVLQSSAIGARLDGAMQGLEGRRFASTTLSLTRRAEASGGSVSLGAVRMESARDFELATHRGYQAKRR